jgi:hypothetical protein
MAPRDWVVPSPKSTTTLWIVPAPGVTVNTNVVVAAGPVPEVGDVVTIETPLPSETVSVWLTEPARAVTVAALVVVRVTCASPLELVVATD